MIVSICGTRSGVLQSCSLITAPVDTRIGKTTRGGRHLATDTDFVAALLQEQHVATVQGSAYGMSPYFRVSYATDMASLEEGCARIQEFCQDLR